jgi:hypothetical protein
MPYDTVFTTEGDSLSVVITDAFGCTAEDQVFITGTKDFELQFVNKVYPNPVNELLYIEYADGMKMNLQLKLVDISGRVAFSSPVRLEQISTSAIEAGTYLLQIISAEGVQSLPVVIMH